MATDDIGSDGLSNTNDIDGSEGNGLPDIGEPNFDWMDNEEYTPITTHYSVKDLETNFDSFTPNDTFFVALNKKNLLMR